MNYLQFLESKKHSIIDSGLPLIWYPDKMFDFQYHCTDIGMKRGRFAELERLKKIEKIDTVNQTAYTTLNFEQWKKHALN